MASEWRELPFDEVAEILPGKYLPASEYAPDGQYVIYGSNSIMGRAQEPLYEGPLIAFARIGTNCGATMFSDKDCWINNNAAGIRARPGIDARFLYYWMQGFDFAQIREGSGQPYISNSTLNAQVVFAPPLDEQRAIAHILGALDDKIELNRQMSGTLERMAQALFKSWFVDFEPVRAKADGREADIPGQLADVFPSRLIDSDFGKIPEGWEIRPIEDLAEIVGGSTPKTERSEYWKAGTHHWATPKDLSGLSMPVLLDTERKLTDEGLDQVSSGLQPAGTVLLSSRAPIGYLAIAEVPAAINQGFIAIRPRRGVSNLFLLRWASAAHEEIVRHANGSTFLEISKSSFRRIRVVAPPDLVIEAFDGLTRPLYSKVVEHERESKALVVLRDLLLPKLISGNLRVPGVG